MTELRGRSLVSGNAGVDRGRTGGSMTVILAAFARRSVRHLREREIEPLRQKTKMKR
jgi:hypothetical protein